MGSDFRYRNFEQLFYWSRQAVGPGHIDQEQSCPYIATKVTTHPHSLVEYFRATIFIADFIVH